MKIDLIPHDTIDAIKSNLPEWKILFEEDSCEKLAKELDGSLFIPSKYEIPDVVLSAGDGKPEKSDAENVQKIYGNLRFLSDSQATDERLWSALAVGPFWQYTKDRWIKGKAVTEAAVKQHFFFGYGSRRSLMRNAISRLWWIGRMTYDPSRSDPWELTKLVCESSDYVMHILERNSCNNPRIIHEFLDAIIELRRQGLNPNTDAVGELSKYLNQLGGLYILDIMPEGRIYQKILSKGTEIALRKQDKSKF